jgi:uncharacterized SAM-binding protein YcdF (DUF218 family)
MLFTVSKILWSLLQPTKAWLLLVALGVLLLYVDRFRLGRFLLSVAVVLAFLTIILPIQTWLASPLEQRFSRLSTLPEKIDGIIVLGGGVDELLTSFYEQPALNYAAERMTEAVSLARRYPQAKLVFTGGSALLDQSKTNLTEADVAERLFVGLGIDKSRIVLESTSRNTYENALNTQNIIQPKPDETWLLVTSALHMPRSIGIFRKIGWNVTPYPTDYRVIAGQRQPNLGFAEKLMIIDSAAKEWVGLVSYYFLGRTSEMFPQL